MGRFFKRLLGFNSTAVVLTGGYYGGLLMLTSNAVQTVLFRILSVSLVDIPSEIGFFNHFTTRAAIINTIVLNSSTTLVLPL